MADFGYDISDHMDIDPIFGTLSDFADLITAAHYRGEIAAWLFKHKINKNNKQRECRKVIKVGRGQIGLKMGRGALTFALRQLSKLCQQVVSNSCLVMKSSMNECNGPHGFLTLKD